jgi:hypothetical protein
MFISMLMVNKWLIYIIEYYSAIKWNELLIHTAAQINFKIISTNYAG